ncbi:MAG: hypothetical protein ABFS17_13850 [Chloroflexota bacterium]
MNMWAGTDHILPLDETLALMKIMDQIRSQIGLKETDMKILVSTLGHKSNTYPSRPTAMEDFLPVYSPAREAQESIISTLQASGTDWDAPILEEWKELIELMVSGSNRLAFFAGTSLFLENSGKILKKFMMPGHLD